MLPFRFIYDYPAKKKSINMFGVCGRQQGTRDRAALPHRFSISKTKYIGSSLRFICWTFGMIVCNNNGNLIDHGVN